jgi:Ca2+-binding EF-hand superfamily protein
LEADINRSGLLTADELYGVMLKLKLEITYQELLELLTDYDVDGNAALDIDEFLQLMTGGQDLSAYGEKNI